MSEAEIKACGRRPRGSPELRSPAHPIFDSGGPRLAACPTSSTITNMGSLGQLPDDVALRVHWGFTYGSGEQAIEPFATSRR